MDAAKILEAFATQTLLSPVKNKILADAGIALWVKRDDLIHPHVSGNKWRKLKHNLVYARQQGYTHLLTYGGAYSNHIQAVAAAGQLTGFQTIGIIRGEETLPLNSTLAFARSCHMHLHYISRTLYREKHLPKAYQNNHTCVIPEGGANALAVIGCAEICAEITLDYQYLIAACGTGATVAGLSLGAPPATTVLGFPALKGGEFLYTDIARLQQAATALQPVVAKPRTPQLVTDYHFGGYAKTTPELLQFCRQFHDENGIEIEPVYTGKMFFGIFDLARKGFFRRGSTLVALHTGGLKHFGHSTAT